uniref:Glycerophosphodiester phosphodiesterase domain containing 4a n=1 Tax=Oncorhynchus mykiss TaxID=8022 RepID=A0A8K9VBE5_ONCMY
MGNIWEVIWIEFICLHCRFKFETLGFWFPWSLVLLVVAAALFTYISLLLVRTSTTTINTAILILLILLYYYYYYTTTAAHLTYISLLLVTAPFLQVGGVLLMTLLSWPIALHFFRMNKRGKCSDWLLALFSLYLVPLAMYSPCIREAGTLGPKPTLLGHRGAPMLAPENTLMSFERAVEAGVDGFETDVTISADGVPFVMHDLTLQRTTNVEEVFPNRTHTPAALFTWSDVQQLNAGAWFLSWDPFGTVFSLSPEQRELAANQMVPSLEEVLDVANRTGRTVLFDLRQPPPGHPYRDNYLNITLDLIHTHINSSQARVLWLPSDQRGEIQQVDPELQQTAGQTASIQELQDNHITTLNLHYSTMSLQHISKYRSVNISVNLYVVNQPWLYSLAWCSGASSVTTNNMLLRDIHTPLLLVTPEQYSVIWVLTDLVSAVLIVCVFIFHW